MYSYKYDQQEVLGALNHGFVMSWLRLEAKCPFVCSYFARKVSPLLHLDSH